MKSQQLILAVVLSTAHALLPGTIVFDLAAGRIDDSVWLSSFSNPNASSSVSVSGYNTSEPYPGTRSDNWRYTVQVVADVPRERGRDFLTASWVRLEPPANLLRDVGNGSQVFDQDESWAVCQFIWVSDKVSRADKVNGNTCEGALDRECYNAWLRALLVRPQGRSSGPCPELKAPTECRTVLGVGEEVNSSGYRFGKCRSWIWG